MDIVQQFGASPAEIQQPLHSAAPPLISAPLADAAGVVPAPEAAPTEDMAGGPPRLVIILNRPWPAAAAAILSHRPEEQRVATRRDVGRCAEYW